jgi:hypothetical protein
MKNFTSAIRREVFIYIIITFFLALIMHSDLLTNPSSRFEMMYAKENYSHPILYSFIIYSILYIIRKILDFVIILFSK